AALEFIGMTPGRPVDPSANLYWPKGERVIAHVEWDQPGAKPNDPPKATRARAEDLVVDAAGKPMPSAGFIFTGAFKIKPEAAQGLPNAGQEQLATDVLDSRSIISIYNERASLLDVPRQAIQAVVYGSQKLNKAYRFAPSQPLQIV